jgi:hypothetical protein
MGKWLGQSVGTLATEGMRNWKLLSKWLKGNRVNTGSPRLFLDFSINPV